MTTITPLRGLAANWTAGNPTLASGVYGWESDTDKLKLGDGSTAWNALPYLATTAVDNGDGTGITCTTSAAPALGQNITGSAAKLTTARNINGVPFDGTGSITVSPGGLTTVAKKTANYTTAGTEIIPADATSGVITITFPTAPADGTQVVVKKVDSSTNAVNLALGGSDVFNLAGGSTTGSLSLQNQSIHAQYAATPAIWYVISTDEPLSGLDARYLASAATATDATKLHTARTINGVNFDGTAPINDGAWHPADYGWIAWVCDPASAYTGIITLAGYVIVTKIKIPVATTITNLMVYVTTAGATLTTSQCVAGLYQGGSLLAATVDQHTAWQTTGLKTMALTAPQAVSAGDAYVALLANGTTMPTFAVTIGHYGFATGDLNLGLTTPNLRAAWTDNGKTTLPSTLGTPQNSTICYWAAAS
jgi:hypothetical protein